ncbi:MAG: hypothetical protein Tsb005_15360 [Gammaproteobacteria bacterium]
MILSKRIQVFLLTFLLTLANVVFAVSSDTLDVQHVREELVRTLQQKGVTFIQLGEYVTIVLPADAVFPRYAPRLTENGEHLLQQVIMLLRSYRKVDIKVAGYTDNIGSKKRNDELSRQRARNVADYLWRGGVGARLQFATGYGENRPIASNKTDIGRALNRRIEIRFRELVV